MAGWKISAFADEYADDFDCQCDALRTLHIEYTELRQADGKNVADWTAGDVKKIKNTLARYGIGVSAIGSPIGKIAIDGDLAAHFDMAERVFETAATLDAKNVRIFSFYLPQDAAPEDCKERVFDALETLLARAAPYGVTLCHENEAAIYGESPERCLQLLERFGGRLKCVFDMGNFVLDGYDPQAAYTLLKSHIAYFHIKDALSAGAVVPAGKGEAHIRDILDAYRMTATEDTFITLEPHLQTFGGLNALVGKTFENPYRYPDCKTAFIDGWNHLKGLL